MAQKPGSLLKKC